MRILQFARLERGDVLVHWENQDAPGLIVAIGEEDRTPYIEVLWDNGRRQRYTIHDVKHLFPWRVK